MNSVNQYRNNYNYVSSNEYQPLINNSSMNSVVNVPISLAKSYEGKYFLGMAEFLSFGEVTNTWARLYNPPNSGVNLNVNVWTVSDVSATQYRIQIWFNSTAPGFIQESTFVTPANTTLNPLPVPKVKLQYAIEVKGLPSGGVKAFGRSGVPEITINSEEEGKFIFPPGGSFLVFISNPETPLITSCARIAFGWWEDPIQ